MQSLPGSGVVTSVPVSPRETPPILLSIAGFDPSSGAGFTADLKVFSAFAMYGVACPTALTVQSTQGVRRSEAVDAALVAETLQCLADDLDIAGIKIGMLADPSIVEAVADWLLLYRRAHPRRPIVLDPVLQSSSGKQLLASNAVDLVQQRLFPLVSVITPNHAEAVALTGSPAPSGPGTAAATLHAASSLLQRMTPGRGAVVVTGGDLGREQAPRDFLLEDAGSAGTWITGNWVDTTSTHGTGCAFSSALLCGLVEGLALEAAVRQAKAYVQAALAAAYPLGNGHGPMHHLFNQHRSE